MRFNIIFSIVAALFLSGCNSGENRADHDHEHGEETHMHNENTSSQNHDNGDYHEEQEEFISGEDSTVDYDHRADHDHQQN